MDDRFEQEFYRSPWHRVLPVGPGGIQPFVRPGRPPAQVAGRQGRRAAVLRALAQALGEIREGLGAFGAFGRWGAPGADPTLAHAACHGRPPSVRMLRAEPRTPAQSAPPPPLRKAA
jgi:hypothetical protein